MALDDIQDPGNLGTLMRTLDWFGFKHLLCSVHTVDCYSAKVVQSSMGSFARMNCVYDDLPTALQQLGMPIVGADLKGVSLEQFDPGPSGVLVLGNEGARNIGCGSSSAHIAHHYTWRQGFRS